MKVVDFIWGWFKFPVATKQDIMEIVQWQAWTRPTTADTLNTCIWIFWGNMNTVLNAPSRGSKKQRGKFGGSKITLTVPLLMMLRITLFQIGKIIIFMKGPLSLSLFLSLHPSLPPLLPPFPLYLSPPLSHTYLMPILCLYKDWSLVPGPKWTCCSSVK